MTAVGLLLIVRTRELGGSYALGGLASGGWALFSSATGPPIGRLIDRRGARRILLVCIAIAVAGWLMVAALPAGAPAGLVVVGAVVAGIGNPPLSATLRAVWGRLLPDPDDLHQIMSLEAAIQEVIFILGPIILVTGFAAASSRLAFVVGAATLMTGGLLFVLHPAAREHAMGTAERTRSGSPLRDRAVLRLVCVITAMGISFGGVEISTTAFSEGAGHRSATGLVLAVWALGSVCGGLLVARTGAPADRERRLLGVLAVLAATTALPTAAVATGLVPQTVAGMAVYALLLFLPGLAIAPSFPLIYGIVGDAAAASSQTETFTWLGASIVAGIALGSALGGVAIGMADDPSGALVVATLGAGLALLIATGTRRARRSARTARGEDPPTPRPGP